MSCNYAEGLSPYEYKGKLGLPETFDDEADVDRKVDQLAEWVRQAVARRQDGGDPSPGSGGVVFHTGAGVSTSAGIPDFRGPRGVWTLEKRGERPEVSLAWDEARPTRTHLALAALRGSGHLDFLVTQNIDGLHLRSGLPRAALAELHGDMFVDRCATCRRMFVRASASQTVGQKLSARGCPGRRGNGRSCRGRLADFVLDWEDELPDEDLDLSDARSALAHLNVVLGSTLQIVPAGNLPLQHKKYHPDGRLVIVNLQPTKHDRRADLVIRAYVDDVMDKLLQRLGVERAEFDPAMDPVSRVKESGEALEWTQDAAAARQWKQRADQMDTEHKRRKKAAKAAAVRVPTAENGELNAISDKDCEGTHDKNDVKVDTDEKDSQAKVEPLDASDSVSNSLESHSGETVEKRQKLDVDENGIKLES